VQAVVQGQCQTLLTQCETFGSPARQQGVAERAQGVHAQGEVLDLVGHPQRALGVLDGGGVPRHGHLEAGTCRQRPAVRRVVGPALEHRHRLVGRGHRVTGPGDVEVEPGEHAEVGRDPLRVVQRPTDPERLLERAQRGEVPTGQPQLVAEPLEQVGPL
jgi:hypothetical protein